MEKQVAEGQIENLTLSKILVETWGSGQPNQRYINKFEFTFNRA